MLPCSTSWWSQPYSRGSYTCIGVGGAQTDISNVATPLYAKEEDTQVYLDCVSFLYFSIFYRFNFFLQLISKYVLILNLLNCFIYVQIYFVSDNPFLPFLLCRGYSLPWCSLVNTVTPASTPLYTGPSSVAEKPLTASPPPPPPPPPTSHRPHYLLPVRTLRSLIKRTQLLLAPQAMMTSQTKLAVLNRTT